MSSPAPGEGDAALPATRFAALRRVPALAVIVAVLVVAAVLVAVALVHGAPDNPTKGAGDLVTYARIVERLHEGEAYYPAVHAELLAGGFGTRSVFNWRMPAYFELLALAPSLAWAQAALALLALVGLVLAYRLFRRAGGPLFAALVAFLLVLSLATVVIPGAVLFSEVTTGLLILVSVAAYGLERRRLGFAAAVAALFLRELAGPYVVICCVMAWRERRWRELAAWVVALALYAGFFAWHMTMVQAALGPADRSYDQGWVQFGGLGFILATAAFNGVLIAAPLAVTALVLPLAVTGLAAWRSATGTRTLATVLAYLALFAVAGKPFNTYWGALYTPLLPLGLAWAAAAARDLARALRG